VTGRSRRRHRKLLDDLNERNRQDFRVLCAPFSNLDKLRKKKIRTATLRNLSIIHNSSDHGKDSVQINYATEVKIYLEIQFNHTFRSMEAFKTSMLNNMLL
jgi:hypothetical protein